MDAELDENVLNVNEGHLTNLVSKEAIWDQLLWVGCFATNGALKFGDHEISSFFHN